MARRRKKVIAAGGHHGGSWKVAYADFMTAMMAFFLLMWLVNMVPTEQKELIAGYFREYSVFDKGGAWMERMEGPSAGVTIQAPNPNEIPGEELPQQAPAAPSADEKALGEQVQGELQEKLGEMAENQVMVEAFDGGLRIQVVDKQGSPIFSLGSANLNATGKQIIAAVGESVNKMANRIAVEGHTDALSYSTSRYTNWELSTERASAARKELEQNGLNPDCLVRVTGYAATEPLIKENPMDPRNRRISVLVYTNTKCGMPGVNGSTVQPPLRRSQDVLNRMPATSFPTNSSN